MNVTAGVTNISIQWGEVDCVEHNGLITGYSVRYGTPSGSEITINGSDADSRDLVIHQLLIRTDYSIEVAAINEDGVGTYSSAVDTTTAVPQSMKSTCFSAVCLIKPCRHWVLSEWHTIS